MSQCDQSPSRPNWDRPNGEVDQIGIDQMGVDQIVPHGFYFYRSYYRKHSRFIFRCQLNYEWLNLFAKSDSNKV